jgi:hypothetical protein
MGLPAPAQTSESTSDVEEAKKGDVERSFAHVLDRGGMRRAWLRGRENLHKRT